MVIIWLSGREEKSLQYHYYSSNNLYLPTHSKLMIRRSCMIAETLPMPLLTKIQILNCSMTKNTAQKGRGPQIFWKSVGREMEMMNTWWTWMNFWGILQTYFCYPQAILTLFAPGGRGEGTLCPPCHVFAYNWANACTSVLKKLNFSQIWVLKGQ